MLAAAPPVGGWDQPYSELWRYVLGNSGPQLFDPHVDLEGHPGNLTFRVLPRLIAAAGGFHHQWQYYLVDLVFGALLLWAAARLFDEALDSRVLATLLAVATAGTWAGATAWVETRPLFDAIGISLVVLAMATRRSWLVLVLSFAATFADERATIALVLVVCWHALRDLRPADAGRLGDIARRFVRPAPVLVVVAVVAHLAVRTWLKHRYGLSEGHNRYPENPFVQARNWPNALWSAFDGLWLVVFAGVATLIARRRRWEAAIVALAGVPSLVAGLSVVDMTRAIAYAWPLAPLAALGLRGLPRPFLHRLAWVAAGICVLSPLVYAAGDQTVDWLYPAPLLVVHLITGGVG